jgi:hypothetical protein
MDCYFCSQVGLFNELTPEGITFLCNFLSAVSKAGILVLPETGS